MITPQVVREASTSKSCQTSTRCTNTSITSSELTTLPSAFSLGRSHPRSVQLPRRQLGRNFKPRPALPLTMPLPSDEAQSFQPRVVFTSPVLFLEHQLNFETCTNFLETATSAATQVASPKLTKCATPFFARVHHSFDSLLDQPQNAPD